MRHCFTLVTFRYKHAGHSLGNDPVENESERLVVADIVKSGENFIQPYYIM
jgi:hypothetical protein